MIFTIAIWVGAIATVGAVLTAAIAIVLERRGGGTPLGVGGKEFRVALTPEQVEQVLRQQSKARVYAARRHPAQSILGFLRPHQRLAK